MTKFIGALVLSLALCAGANAGDDKHDSDNYGFNNFDQHHDFDKHDKDGWGGRPVAAPEIDPASALSGLTLLGAGLAVIRGRRPRK